MKKTFYKYFVLMLLLIVFLLITVRSYTDSVSSNLKDNFFRLHILANSDSSEDQDLKLKVRDAILEYMNAFSKDICSKEDSLSFVRNHLNTLQEKKISEKEENKMELDNIILDQGNSNYNGYDVIIAYINSRNYINSNEKSNEKKEEIIPYINKNRIIYTEKVYKIENITKRKSINKNSMNPLKKLSLKNKIPIEFLLKLENLEKNTGVSTKKELLGKKKYQDNHRFLTSDNLYKNFENYVIKKSNKVHESGLICDVGYTVLEFFQCGIFNMSRLKPIDFSDMKLDIKVKYKQMSPDEKAVYFEKIKDLKIRQKKEKIIRIEKYMEDGTNILFIKFTNECNIKEKKRAYEIDTLFNTREIEAAKLCIKNNYFFPPENYFENSFIPKLTKDEETGEINFWTKNFYRRLLKGYFKEEEKKLLEKEEKEKKEKEEKEKEKEEKEGKEGKVEIGQKEEKKNLFQEFENKSIEFNNELNTLVNDIRKGTWMR